MDVTKMGRERETEEVGREKNKLQKLTQSGRKKENERKRWGKKERIMKEKESVQSLTFRKHIFFILRDSFLWWVSQCCHLIIFSQNSH